MTLTSSPPSTVVGEAFVTLVTSDSYVVGALVLAHSLRRVGTCRRLICMVTANISYDSIASLREVYEVRTVSPLDSGDASNLQLLGRPELGTTFTKIQLWTFTDLTKVVFLDADMLILQNVDDLFAREELSACADVGWPDCFNSGLFVCQPSLATYNGLMSLALTQGSFDGGDQGLLNSYFADWAAGPSARRIPFVYNLTFNACYSYAPAFEKYKGEVRAVHFIGSTKPWNFARFSDGQVAPRGDGSLVHLGYVQIWWELHDLFVKPKAEGGNPPSFMTLYSGSGYNPYGKGAPLHSASQPSGSPDLGANSDFANYRIKWTADVETFFQKKLSKSQPRKLVADGEDSEEEERNYDPEKRDPIRKPSPSNLAR